MRQLPIVSSCGERSIFICRTATGYAGAIERSSQGSMQRNLLWCTVWLPLARERLRVRQVLPTLCAWGVEGVTLWLVMMQSSRTTVVGDAVSKVVHRG